jgi:addiction module HigA family antidote
VSARSVALKLKVSPSTFARLINGQSNATPEMTLRLSKTLGRSAESWLAMQSNYDLWQARQRLDLTAVETVVTAHSGLPGLPQHLQSKLDLTAVETVVTAV